MVVRALILVTALESLVLLLPKMFTVMILLNKFSFYFLHEHRHYVHTYDTECHQALIVTLSISKMEKRA